jgi:hypothetical protein
MLATATVPPGIVTLQLAPEHALLKTTLDVEVGAEVLPLQAPLT